MINEITIIEEEIANLERVLELIQRRRTRRRTREYTQSLLTIKENLIKLRRKLRRLPEATESDTEDKIETRDLINTMLYSVRERERNVQDTDTKILIEDMRDLRSIFSELSGTLPIERILFLLDYSNLPEDIREEVKLDFQEIRKCYYAGAFRSAIAMCGRVLEVILATKYYEEEGIDPIQEHWSIGLTIRRSFEDDVINEPALGDISNMINRSRISSVHATRRLYRPQQSDTKSLIELTIGLVKKFFPPNE